MKKLLLMTLATVVVLTGCKKDDQTTSTLIQEVVLPPLTEQFSEGSPVTIKGVGFTKTDVIALRTQTKTTTDVPAVITEVTAVQVTFTVPSGLTAGENAIVLKRGAAEQVLGNITITDNTDDPEPDPSVSVKLYGLGWNSDESASRNSQTDLFQIDPATGVATHVTTFPDGQQMSESLAIGHTIYAMETSDWEETSNWDAEYIVSFNVDSKEFKKVSDRISNNNCYDILGVIDGELHVLASVDNVIKLVSINAATGAKTEVANFGNIQDAPYFNGFMVNTGGFAYDAVNNKIVIAGYWDGDQSEPQKEGYVQTVVFDLATKTIAYFAVEDVFEHQCYAIGSQIYRGYEDWDKATDATSFVLDALDDKYQKITHIASINEPIMNPVCDAAQGLFYGYCDKGFYSMDMKTTKMTILGKSDERIGELVVVR